MALNGQADSNLFRRRALKSRKRSAMNSHRFLIVLTLSTVLSQGNASPGGKPANSLQNNLRGSRHLQGGGDHAMPMLTVAGRLNMCEGDW